MESALKNLQSGDFPGGLVAKTALPTKGETRWGQGTRSHMAQLRVFMLQLKIPHPEAQSNK